MGPWFVGKLLQLKRLYSWLDLGALLIGVAKGRCTHDEVQGEEITFLACGSGGVEELWGKGVGEAGGERGGGQECWCAGGRGTTE